MNLKFYVSILLSPESPAENSCCDNMLHSDTDYLCPRHTHDYGADVKW